MALGCKLVYQMNYVAVGSYWRSVVSLNTRAPATGNRVAESGYEKIRFLPFMEMVRAG